MTVDREQLLAMYRCMLKIREFETRAHDMFLTGGLPGFLHLYSGEEAVAAGVSAHLRPDDLIASTHRGHGHLIAKGGDVKLMMAEILGKATGYCKGKGGSMHIADVSLGSLGANGIVGASLPIGTGAGLACQYKGTDSVVVCFFGDGATNRGTFHESLNMAAIWDLPVIYVCENNLYGVGFCQRDHMRVCDIADRASSYGFPGVVVDGNDVVAVSEAAGAAVDRARAGGGPTLIECKTWRHYGHFVGDAAVYRDPAEHEAWLARDPILVCEAGIASNGWATQGELAEMKTEIAAEIQAAVDFGLSSPMPAVAELLTDVFSEMVGVR